MTEYVAKQLNLKLGRAIFRDKETNDFKCSTNQIRFSYEHIDASVKNGFVEYPTIGYLWFQNGYAGTKKTVVTGSKITCNRYGTLLRKEVTKSYWKFEGGKKAVWMIVLHEMAHAVDFSKRGDSNHDQNFQDCLDELIVLFPYVECENI